MMSVVSMAMRSPEGRHGDDVATVLNTEEAVLAQADGMNPGSVRTSGAWLDWARWGWRRAGGWTRPRGRRRGS